MIPVTESTSTDLSFEQLVSGLDAFDTIAQPIWSLCVPSEPYPATVDPRTLDRDAHEHTLLGHGSLPPVSEPNYELAGAPYVSAFGSPEMSDFVFAPTSSTGCETRTGVAMDSLPQVATYGSDHNSSFACFEEDFQVPYLLPLLDAPVALSVPSSPDIYTAFPTTGFYPPATFQYDSDVVESSEDDESDSTSSEWGSSPRLPPLTQRRSFKNARGRRCSSSSSSSGLSSGSDSPRATKRPLKMRTHSSSSKKPARKSDSLRTPSRSIQVPVGFVYPEPTSFICPIPGCEHVQWNRRMPDLKRHISVHYSEARSDWICCGVPLQEAQRYGVTDFSGAKFWQETGRVMVGGCGLIFTRKDAYKRHLSDCKHPCKGDVNGDWVPGNARQSS